MNIALVLPLVCATLVLTSCEASKMSGSASNPTTTVDIVQAARQSPEESYLLQIGAGWAHVMVHGVERSIALKREQGDGTGVKWRNQPLTTLSLGGATAEDFLQAGTVGRCKVVLRIINVVNVEDVDEARSALRVSSEIKTLKLESMPMIVVDVESRLPTLRVNEEKMENFRERMKDFSVKNRSD